MVEPSAKIIQRNGKTYAPERRKRYIIRKLSLDGKLEGEVRLFVLRVLLADKLMGNVAETKNHG